MVVELQGCRFGAPQSNGMSNGGESQLPYRQQVIRALVQRYIESARREFEESKRKGGSGREGLVMAWASP